MQHVANNVMIEVRNLKKGDEMERKRGFEIISAYEGKESLFQTFDKTFSRIWFEAAVGISIAKHLENDFQICCHSIKTMDLHNG